MMATLPVSRSVARDVGNVCVALTGFSLFVCYANSMRQPFQVTADSSCDSRCRRTRFQTLARDFLDPVSSIEGSKGSDESAAAIGGNHRHDVDFAAEKLC